MIGSRCRWHGLVRIVAAWLVGAVGCGGTTEPGRPVFARRPDGALVLEVLAETRAGAARRVSKGDTLQTGDRLWFRLATDDAKYIYVLQIFPDGSAELLYPPQGEVQLEAGGARRVPFDPRQHFVLDDRPGLEHVLLIASRKRLGESDSRLASLVQVVEQEHQWPSGIPLRPAVDEPRWLEASATTSATTPGSMGETGQGERGDRGPDAPAVAGKRRKRRPAERAQDDGHDPQPQAEPPPAAANGFVDLLGPTRSLERGLRLGTDPSRLRVVPDEAGISVSLFWFYHRP